MQLTPKASLAFKLEPNSYKTTFGSNVITCLTPVQAAKKGVKNFSDLPLPVAQLKILNDNLITAVANRVDGGRAASAALKTAKAAWTRRTLLLQISFQHRPVAARNLLLQQDLFLPRTNRRLYRGREQLQVLK